MVGANGLLDFAGEVLMHRLGINLEHEKSPRLLRTFLLLVGYQGRLLKTTLKITSWLVWS